MANPNTVRKTRTLGDDAAENETRLQFNNLVAKFQALLEKLDADSGVSDTNYASTLGANSANEAKQVLDHAD